MSKLPPIKVRRAVDRLGYVKAQIANWQAEEQELKAVVKESEYDEVDGELFHAVVVEQNGAKIDTAKVRKYVPSGILAKCWKPYKSVRVMVTARKAAA